MKEYRTFQERHDFEEQVLKVIQGYIHDRYGIIEDSCINESYDCLCVNPKTFEIKLCKIGESPEGWDIYHVEQLICMSENISEIEPDNNAIFNLVSTYFFVK